MSLDFINPFMLLGLAGLALPVLAHLLSKKKYDVVEWGAMQFLELGRNTRRRIRLEQILLMLLRMGMIALVALAVSRPWLSGGCVSGLVSSETRDVVFVIDGSYSMGWQGKAETPHAAAIVWAKNFLDELQTGDSVAVIDARERPRAVIASPTRDLDRVRKVLDELPAASGSADLAGASAKAVQILGRASSLSREIIVLTDGQAHGWRAEDEALWSGIDALRKEPSVAPRLWAVDVADHGSGDKPNLSVARLQLSRELTVPDFALRVRTRIRYSGDAEGITPRIHFHVNGQRIDDMTVKKTIPPHGEAGIEFTYRFPSVGSYLVSVVLEEDDLPGDDAAHAAVTVDEAIPVLLVDGDPQLEPTRSEAWFAGKALTPEMSDAPWVRARTIPWNEFSREALEGVAVVFLANVPRVDAVQAEFLAEYVRQGGGLFIALGDRVDPQNYTKLLGDAGVGLLPVALERIEKDEAEALRGVRVVDDSLQLPWLARFHTVEGDGFTEARYDKWWRLRPVEASPEADPQTSSDASDALVADDMHDTNHAEDSAAILAARLETGDPLLVSRRSGRGEVLLFASTLDADWNTLPARPDYVSFLHEVVFHLATGGSARNVAVGEPLLLRIPPDLPLDEYAFRTPGGDPLAPQAAGDELRPAARLAETRQAGIYEFGKRNLDATLPPEPPEYFVVDFDREESDLTPLDPAARERLAGDDRLTFVSTVAELKSKLFTDGSQTEVWPFLLFVFLAILVGEVYMTRRLVQGGHVATDDSDVTGEAASLDGFLAEVDRAATPHAEARTS